MAKNTPGVQNCTRGANLHLGANCAHGRGLNYLKLSIVFSYIAMFMPLITVFMPPTLNGLSVCVCWGGGGVGGGMEISS